MRLPPKWLRRLLIDPALVLLMVFAVVSLPVWLILAAFVSRYVPGNWRILRIIWFLFLYLLVDAAAIVAMFVLWLVSGFGWKLRGPLFQKIHYGLLALMLGIVIKTAKRTFRLAIVQQGPPPTTGQQRTRPALVLSRHAGPGDSMMLMDALCNVYRREPRIVLKEFLQWDPAVDVILNRLPASFVPSGKRAGAAVVAAIADLAASMKVDDAFVIFPEGANYTVGRAERAIQKLREIGRPDLAERAEMLKSTLPPKPTGVMTALKAAPLGSDVFFVGHAGLEGFVTAGDIWRAMPMDTEVVVKIWHY
ncbi:MAG: 1-acyl-sn-glycerol-3-phosphate acyltransferase, partial [Acidimicrobiia bacterium]|nr:1-acyl-sn-glycerol-3-phosphate acyltransferase [Acidimicrobiia bacterium]